MNIDKMLYEFEENFKLSPYAEKKLVFGEGNPDADIMLVGEAPGKDEEASGKPFVGKAGKNLSIFLDILSLKRHDIFITNVVKFRPTTPGKLKNSLRNRAPSQHEVNYFLPLLMQEIDVIKPKIIVTLGNVPLRALYSGDSANIGQLHGETLQLDNAKLFPLYHPAAIIYNKSLKETYDLDLIKLSDVISNLTQK